MLLVFVVSAIVWAIFSVFTGGALALVAGTAALMCLIIAAVIAIVEACDADR